MYQVSNSFLQAMDDISRTLAVEVEISGETYPTESIIDFELERGAFDGDVFTIGQTLSSALTLTIFTTSTIKPGDEVKLFVDLLVGESYRRVPMGIYYVDSTSINQEKMRLTCYDKMVSLVEEYIPSGDHKTLSALFNDVKHQIGMTSDGVFTDVAIDRSLYGYTYRETLGFIASLNGGNMSINRAGHLEIQRFQAVERAIPAKACFSFEVKEAYRVSKVFCQFGDVGITRGDSSGQCVAFENPYVTEQNIDAIYNQLNDLSFTAASLNYRGDLTLDPGDLFTFTDYKDDQYVLMCGRNKVTFNGGLSGQLESVGESENSNVYGEHQLKYKKNITKLTAELGKIQAVVEEVEQSQDGLEERVKKVESEMTADAITNTVKQNFYTKTETENAITSKGYATQTQLQQTANSITSTVSQNYYTKTETENAITSKDYATKSEVQQTTNNITYKFTQSGGYNLVRNGNPKSNNYRHWWISSNGNWYLNSPTDIGVQTTSTNEAYAGSANFKVESGKTYSFSCYLMAEVNTKGADVYFIGSANNDGAYTQIQHIYNGSGDGVWRQVKGTFTVGSNINYGFIRIDNNGRKDTSTMQYTVVFFSEVQMVKGSECYPQWSPNPNEVYDGITTIDKDGITVSQSNINTKTTMSASGFYINKNGQGDVFKVDENGLAITGKITSNEVIMANGGMYTGQSVRGTNPAGFTLVGSNGSVALRADNGSVYLQPSDNEAKVTAPADPNTFKNLRAYNLIANNKVYANGVALTSSIEKKKNIEAYEESALQQILQTKIYRYHLLDDLDEEMKRIGIILQEAPVDAIDIEGVGVDLYQMVAMSWKAIQELKQENEKCYQMAALKEEIKVRETENEKLKEEINKLKAEVESIKTLLQTT